MDAQAELEAFQSELAAKGVKVVPKQGRWWNFLGWLVMVVTFGQNRRFKDYITTIYKTIAVPDGWEQWPAASRLEILVHEAHHVEQFRKWTPPLFALLYLLLPFPVGLAWFRYYFERSAYAAGYKVSIKYGANREFLIEHGVEQLTGAGYAWAWPFKKSVRKWFEENV